MLINKLVLSYVSKWMAGVWSYKKGVRLFFGFKQVNVLFHSTQAIFYFFKVNGYTWLFWCHFFIRNITVDLLPFLQTNPLCEGVYSLRKEFAACGSKFFPYRVDPFSEGDRVDPFSNVTKTILPGWPPLKVYTFLLNSMLCLFQTAQVINIVTNKIFTKDFMSRSWRERRNFQSRLKHNRASRRCVGPYCW